MPSHGEMTANQKAAPVALTPVVVVERAAQHAEEPVAKKLALDCSSETTRIDTALWWIGAVKDKMGEMRGIFDSSKSALEVCPDVEVLWYALIRAAELESGSFPAAIRSQSYALPRDLAQHAANLYPKSVRILTVYARLLGTEEAARAALALDSRYVPATIALADALTKAGKGHAALSILENARVRSAHGVHLTRSRALLSIGHARRAAASAQKELASPNLDSVEPFLEWYLRRDAEEALGLALRADHQEDAAHAHLLSAARMGSKTAQAQVPREEWVQ